MALEKNYNQIVKDIEKEKDYGRLSMAKKIAKGRLDPVYFGEEFLGLKFHDAQKVWLWLTTKTRIKDACELAASINLILPPTEQLIDYPFLKNILCPSNRFGKTFVTSVKHIWMNFYKIGAQGPPDYINDIRYATLNLSPHSMQVDAAYRYIVDILQSKLIYKWEGKSVRNECNIGGFLVDQKKIRREIVFSNNSMIKGAPTGDDQASSLAGTQFYYISYDEAPQSNHLRSELPAKIQSRLIDTGGPLDIIGTPEVDKPSHTYYNRIAKQGLVLEKGFFTLQGRLTDNIFIGAEERDSVLKAIKETDPAKYRQVAFGEFVTTGAKLYDSAVIANMWNDKEPITQGYANRNYIIGVDWGFSDTGDPTVFKVFDYTELKMCSNPSENKVYYEMVYSDAVKGGSPYEALAKLRLLQQDFNEAMIIHDSSGMGGVMIKKMLRELHVRHLYDFAIAKKAKDEMLFLTVRAMTYKRKYHHNSSGKLVEDVPMYGKIRSFQDPILEEQLGNYRMDDKKLEQDHVIAFALPIWYLEKKFSGHQTKVYDLNILADSPENVLKIPNTQVKTKSFNITEKIIS